ncbi:hypothetical protein [Phocaeicola vulgatus]|uniref:hypothetical protein n=1 Tax=Phocaeicola vulgatus TaxID=821 RepID=UPI00202F08CB|nr:hypothetical protein [Phocaeicola vulgatus]MCM1740821.1 hypothetical protein [Phocaeicola vulgatus]MCM1750278.1 hypothetical protein [Phocaeicola vulgatus]
MGFTTPCFIRKNTETLRKKLEELGYEILNSGNTTLDAHNYDGKGSHKSIEEGKAIITSYGNLYGVIYNVDTVTKKGRIDCGTNEELFLAIAALRDDTNNNQWFIAESSLSVSFDDAIGNDHYFVEPKGRFFFWGIEYQNSTIISGNFRKATVDELIEHFKTKEE